MSHLILTRLTGERLCWARFRFNHEQLRFLVAQLQIPAEVQTYVGDVCSGHEGLCILLRRLAFPARFIDLEMEFRHNSGATSQINNHMLQTTWEKWSAIMDFHPALKKPEVLQRFAAKITGKGSPLSCCFGFIDGTERQICRPSGYLFQLVVFNGHKRNHNLKYQSVTTPSGICVALWGPLEGRRHNATMLRFSSLLDQIEEFCKDHDGSQFYLYGDPAYPLTECLQRPVLTVGISDDDLAWNKAMSSVRESASGMGFRKGGEHFFQLLLEERSARVCFPNSPAVQSSYVHGQCAHIYMLEWPSDCRLLRLRAPEPCRLPERNAVLEK